MIPLNCSGLVTLSGQNFASHRHVNLDQGDSRVEDNMRLYLDLLGQRKILYSDVLIKVSQHSMKRIIIDDVD